MRKPRPSGVRCGVTGAPLPVRTAAWFGSGFGSGVRFGFGLGLGFVLGEGLGLGRRVG